MLLKSLDKQHSNSSCHFECRFQAVRLKVERPIWVTLPSLLFSLSLSLLTHSTHLPTQNFWSVDGHVFNFSVQGIAKQLLFPVLPQFTEAFVQSIQIPDGLTSDSGLKMEVLKVCLFSLSWIERVKQRWCWCCAKHKTMSVCIPVVLTRSLVLLSAGTDNTCEMLPWRNESVAGTNTASRVEHLDAERWCVSFVLCKFQWRSDRFKMQLSSKDVWDVTVP